MKSTKPTKRIVLKILDILEYGLVSGLGTREPGKMCVEAAICYAYDLPHGDKPPCVGYAVRGFKIKLNDCGWSSTMVRADGMRELAIAQLGSDALDQRAFGERMFIRGTQKLLPYVFRREAKNLHQSKRAEMLEWADKCESVKTFEEARTAARNASASAYSSASAYASAFAYSSASAYSSAFASASAYASVSAYASAYTYDYAYAYASASAYVFDENDELLRLTAQVGLDVLKAMKSPGCRWLHLAKAPSVLEPSEKV